MRRPHGATRETSPRRRGALGGPLRGAHGGAVGIDRDRDLDLDLHLDLDGDLANALGANPASFRTVPAKGGSSEGTGTLTDEDVSTARAQQARCSRTHTSGAGTATSGGATSGGATSGGAAGLGAGARSTVGQESTSSTPGSTGQATVEPPSFVEGGCLRFVTVRKLGRGGMAHVWEGREVATGRRVALKTIRPETLRKYGARGRFALEATLTAQIHHPGVVACEGLRTTDDGVDYIVLELLEGRTLKQHMRSQGEVGPRMAITVALQLLRALEAAHRAGVVHRDIKPSNIMLVPHELAGVPRVKLVDFGLSERMEGDDPAPRSAQGRTLGTPAYVSPEQALGRPSDARSDIYSVCAVLYELLSGARLFRARTVNMLVLRHLHDAPVHLRERAPWISGALADVIMRGLSKRPQDRPASAAQLSRELARAMRRPAQVAGDTTGLAMPGHSPVRSIARPGRGP